MPKHARIEHLRTNLHYFDLDSLEMEFLLCFIKSESIEAKNISSLLPPPFRQKGPNLYRILKRLASKGFIEKIGENPLKYRLVEINTIKKLLEKKILYTQKKLENQKNNYYSIITTITQFQELEKSHQNAELELKNVPTSVNPYIRQEIFDLEANSPLHYENGEFNVIISLNKEMVQFHLNSVQFHYQNGDFLLYGGFIDSDIDEITEKEDILTFIHQYHVNGLVFKYKLERKGYIENRKRSISKPIIASPNDEIYVSRHNTDENNLVIQTKFLITIDKVKHEGIIASYILHPNQKTLPIIVRTIWAENSTILGYFLSRFGFKVKNL